MRGLLDLSKKVVLVLGDGEEEEEDVVVCERVEAVWSIQKLHHGIRDRTFTYNILDFDVSSVFSLART